MTRRPTRHPNIRRGFTLVELGIVGAILAALAAAVYTVIDSQATEAEEVADQYVDDLASDLAEASNAGDTFPAAPTEGDVFTLLSTETEPAHSAGTYLYTGGSWVLQ